MNTKIIAMLVILSAIVGVTGLVMPSVSQDAQAVNFGGSVTGGAGGSSESGGGGSGGTGACGGAGGTGTGGSLGGGGTGGAGSGTCSDNGGVIG